MKLPERFRDEMQSILGAEAEAFFDAYNGAPFRGVSVNTAKISVEDFLNIAPFRAVRVPWSETGLQILDDFEPGQHPYYHAGLYYVQEPSAMLPVELLRLEPGDVLFDACAAPGGKSMQAYVRLCELEKHDGERISDAYGAMSPFLVVACDRAESRAKAILRNAERYGVRDFVLLREDATHVIASGILAKATKILLDAPCSGEGMFRKDNRAVKAWLESEPDDFREIQTELLQSVAQTNARIVYSTCTFNRLENEAVIRTIEESHRLECARRLFPHRDPGEGHFAAVLTPRREPDESGSEWASAIPESASAAEGKPKTKRRSDRSQGGSVFYEEAPPQFAAFLAQYGLSGGAFEGRYELKGEELFLLPRRPFEAGGLEVIRRGLLVGRIVHDRKGIHFWPSQALAHYIDAKSYRLRLDFPLADPRVMKYLRGETLEVQAEESGYYLVCVDGYALGFASVKQGVFKNLYKQSWRVLK